jgi:formylglycine-generating enzyme required for sulfatase activity
MKKWDFMGAWAASLRGRLAVNRKDGTLLVWVPPGEFEMGDGKDGNCPKHRVYLDGYWMGAYCVTNVQYAKFVTEGKGREPDNQKWKDAAFAKHPVVDVSWDDCVAYAKWAGLSLPTEAQWEKACRGPKGLIYPWGKEWDEKRCRNDKTKGNDQTAAVGAYAAGLSGYGTYQQSGNVWEWCADWYEEKYYTEKGAAKNPTGPAIGSNRVYRGGSWWGGDASYFRGANRYYNDPALRFGNQGFRLVRMVS